MDTSSSGFTAAAPSLRESCSPICCRSPKGDEWCWFWHSGPYQQILPFFLSFFLYFQSCWLGILLENRGNRRKRGKKREGENSPRARGRYCMHVHWSTRFVASCLRIFSGESRLSTDWGRCGVGWGYDYTSATQFYWGNRETLSAQFCYFFPLRHAYHKICLQSSSLTICTPNRSSTQPHFLSVCWSLGLFLSPNTVLYFKWKLKVWARCSPALTRNLPSSCSLK